MPRKRQSMPIAIASLSGAIIGFVLLGGALVILALGIAGVFNLWVALIAIPSCVAAAISLVAAHMRRHSDAPPAALAKKQRARP